MRMVGKAAILAVLLADATVVQAATGTVLFNGNVLASCTITLGTAGILEISTDGQTLSTRNAGGGGLARPASAAILTTGANYRVSVSSPTGFVVAPAGADAGVTFETRYTAAGVTTGIDILSGTSTLLAAGLTNLTVNLTANRPLGFPAGPYTAQSTITCE